MQITIVLDSGTFLDNAVTTEYEIGYFQPIFVIHGDGEELRTINATELPSPCKQLHFRHLDSRGVDRRTGVAASQCLVDRILRLPKLYGRNVPVDRDAFNFIFKFNSGLFCCSKPKVRDFKQIDKHTRAEVARRSIGPIPHDVLIMYELSPGDTLALFCDEAEVWSTKNHPNVQKRFDIDVIADHATSDKYYCDAVTVDKHYYVPNQGDPPPDSMGGRP